MEIGSIDAFDATVIVATRCGCTEMSETADGNSRVLDNPVHREESPRINRRNAAASSGAIRISGSLTAFNRTGLRGAAVFLLPDAGGAKVGGTFESIAESDSDLMTTGKSARRGIARKTAR